MPPVVPMAPVPNGVQQIQNRIINPPVRNGGAPVGGPGGVPPLGGAPVNRAANGRLDRKIEDVCKRVGGVFPLASFSQYGNEMLLQGPNPVDLRMAQRLLTALAATPLGDNGWKQISDGCTVRQFRAMNAAGQLKIIDDIWKALASAHRFDTVADNMSDPEYNTPPNARAPLPSSWCPVSRGSTSYHKRLAGKRPWRELGVGFRIDGSDQTAIQRNTTTGFTQQRLCRPFMLGVRGQELDGTVMMDQTRARIWTGNRDIYNETAVCVSRNFFGATAFPERETINGVGTMPNPTCYLWALNCKYLIGFDTEDYQVKLGNASQWRPGEKAFRAIPADRVIGYVPIKRHGAPAEGGWRFEIADDADWTFTGPASIDQRNYLNDELNAWRGRHEINGLYDFATG